MTRGCFLLAKAGEGRTERTDMGKGIPGKEAGKRPKILLLGNPQVGKTALWSELSEGRRSPFRSEGEIMEVRRAPILLRGETFELIDPPGIQSLALDMEEVHLVKRILLAEGPAIILLVVDAKNLKRGLMLYLEAMELQLPLVMAINMSDEARQRGITIDPRAASSLLGIEACLTSALEGEGISTLRRCLAHATPPARRAIYPGSIQRSLEELAAQLGGEGPARLLCLLLYSGDREARNSLASWWGAEKAEALSRRIAQVQSQFSLPLSLVMAEARLRAAEDLREQLVQVMPSRRVPFADKVDHWVRTPPTGFLAFALILILLFLFVGRFGAGTLGWLFQDQFFNRVAIPACTALVRPLQWPFLEDMLVGPFGLISMGLSAALGLILPILGTFFFFVALLEDSGYIPRLGVLLHRLFKHVGLNGKAVLTMFLGFSCVTMATLTTRLLDSKKERLIATFLLSLGIPCSAQLSVIFALAPALPISGFAFVVLFVFLFGLGMGAIANRLVPGLGSDFLMEVFPLRIPRIKDVLLKTYFRVFWFLKEAIPLFLLGTLILFLSNEIGLLYSIERLAKPLVTGLFGLPPEATDVFMMCFIRKEGAVPILRNMVEAGRLNHVQVVISLILTTLFIPCISTTLVVLKQQGLKNALYIMGAILILCVATGGILNSLFHLAGITF